jgi:hypothetical protein
MSKNIIGDRNLISIENLSNMLRGTIDVNLGYSALVDWDETAKFALADSINEVGSGPGTILSAEAIFDAIFGRAMMQRVQIKLKAPA